MTTRLRARLATHVRSQPIRSEPASLLGVEHEYSLRDPSGKVDFRRLLHRLPVEGLRLDPGDPNAYRCVWGGALTCDGPEAEVASPPVRAVPGFTNVLDSWARVARSELERLLPSGVCATGYSTHLSAFLPSRGATRIARRYSRTFGPGLMLLMDRPDSPGLLVRPRPGRLELGGEYVSGSWLRAAAAYVAGSTRAAATGRFPRAVRASTERAIERYGWFIARDAFGEDLYAKGRAASLRRAHGRTISAQDQLEVGWELARAELHGFANESELLEVDRLVAGDAPLPLEAEPFPEDSTWVAPRPSAATGQVLRREVRSGYSVHPHLATWDFTVFALHGVTRTGYLCVPRDWLDDFFVELYSDALDDEIIRFLAAPDRGRVLASSAQTTEPGLYDRIDAPSDLVPAERDPITGRPGGGAAGPGGRRGKQRSDRAPRPRGRWILAAAIAAVLVVVLVTVAIAAATGGGGTNTASEKPTTTQAGRAGGVPRAGANFRPNGTTSATIGYTQDGTYQVTQAITVVHSNVRPGDTIQVSTLTTSIGPDWARPPGGEFQLVCDGTAQSNFQDASSSTLVLSPGSASSTTLVAGISQGGTPPASLALTVPLAGGQFHENPQGCNKTSTSDTVATLRVPPTISAGRYRVVPSWGLYAEFPGEQNSLTYASGSYPVLTVLRPPASK